MLIFTKKTMIGKIRDLIISGQDSNIELAIQFIKSQDIDALEVFNDEIKRQWSKKLDEFLLCELYLMLGTNHVEVLRISSLSIEATYHYSTYCGTPSSPPLIRMMFHICADEKPMYEGVFSYFHHRPNNPCHDYKRMKETLITEFIAILLREISAI